MPITKLLILVPFLLFAGCASSPNLGKSPLEQTYKAPSPAWSDIENNLSRQLNIKDWSFSAVLVTKSLIRAKRDQTQSLAIDSETEPLSPEEEVAKYVDLNTCFEVSLSSDEPFSNNVFQKFQFESSQADARYKTQSMIKDPLQGTSRIGKTWYGDGEHYNNITGTVVCSKKVSFSEPVRLYVVRESGLEDYMEWTPTK